MKKLLLSITAVVAGFVAYGQVVCAGVSPAAIQGNYTYGNQANCGGWPGETDDGSWGAWTGGLNFNNPGDYIQGELMLVEDGTPGVNPQGIDSTHEGCNALINNLAGKIAVVYRNTCWFSSKVYYAEQAGAIGVIVVNREDAIINMLGNTDPINGPLGADCHIPAVGISSVDGATLVAEMQNGPVVMFIGNKLGAFPNDAGAVKGEFLVPPFGGDHIDLFDGFELGIQVYNYGSGNQSNVTVNASIDGATVGNVYDETIVIGPMNSGDTAFIFPGNTLSFPAFNLGTYQEDDYTLTYTIDLGMTDDFAFDNVYQTEFKIQSDNLSSSRMDASNMPIASWYPSNSTTEYQSCMFVQEPNGSAVAVDGVYFIPHTDTSQNSLAGAEIFVNAYQWDDAWVDINDVNYDWTPASTNAYDNLNLVTFATHYPASDNEVDQVAYAQFATQIQLQNNVRYMFCLQTFESATISFGYDNSMDYGANYSIFAMPVSPIHIDGSWYTAAWVGGAGPSIALNTFDPAQIGLEEVDVLDAKAFPNPTNDVVTVSVNTNGAANLVVTDVAGKVAMSSEVTIVNGGTKVDMSALESGVYVFTITMENGLSSQFNVVKN